MSAAAVAVAAIHAAFLFSQVDLGCWHEVYRGKAGAYH